MRLASSFTFLTPPIVTLATLLYKAFETASKLLTGMRRSFKNAYDHNKLNEEALARFDRSKDSYLFHIRVIWILALE